MAHVRESEGVVGRAEAELAELRAALEAAQKELEAAKAAPKAAGATNPSGPSPSVSLSPCSPASLLPHPSLRFLGTAIGPVVMCACVCVRVGGGVCGGWGCTAMQPFGKWFREGVAPAGGGHHPGPPLLLTRPHFLSPTTFRD